MSLCRVVAAVQGEKGEPGLIVGPDGNLLSLEGLTGVKVSLSCWRSRPNVLPVLICCSVDSLC